METQKNLNKNLNTDLDYKERDFNLFLYNNILAPKNIKFTISILLLLIFNIIAFQVLKFIFAEKINQLEVRLIIVGTYLFLDLLIVLTYFIIKYYKNKYND